MCMTRLHALDSTLSGICLWNIEEMVEGKIHGSRRRVCSVYGTVQLLLANGA